ncbi:UvrD-helicase domain-containing protein [Patulibacter sp. NPDC049589]|uniref:UvrD-helicase domain-containing protein n=1 Tax=Patulibacter sp. NPDC049589 TaxID=3154731 RepID=UPI003430BC56
MPTLVFAKQFLDDFAKLQPVVRQKVRELPDKFEHAAHSGVHLEKLNASKDDRVRTVRVDGFWRGVVVRLGEARYALLRVMAHDDANEWAVRQRFGVNPVTGIVEILDVPGVAEHVSALMGPDAGPRPSGDDSAALFSERRDRDFAQVGVDEDLVPILRRIATEEELYSIANYLPEAQADAVLLLADGKSVDEVWKEIQASYEVDPTEAIDTNDLDSALTRPASKSSFIVTTNDDELVELLTGDFEAWRTFLHPEQRKLAEKPVYNGPARITGGAGTGKTVVLIHRARFLARALNESGDTTGRILVATFTRSLSSNLERTLRTFCAPEEYRRLQVTTVDALASQALASASSRLRPAQSDELRELAHEAVGMTGLDELGLDQRFLIAEWEQVVLARGIRSLPEYATSPRPGRGVRMTRPQRKIVWSAIERLTADLATRHRATYLQSADLAADQLAARSGETQGGRLFAHAVIDEAQDLHPAQWRLIRAAVNEGPNDLFIVGDAHQRIYDYRVSLSRLGIETRGRSRRLKINYRTSQAILAQAQRILRGEAVDDLDGGVEEIAGYRSAFDGPAPTSARFVTPADEAQYVADKIQAWLASGVAPSSIGVTGRTRAVLKPVQDALSRGGIVWTDVADDGTGVRTATMHSAKGLEFARLALVALNADTVPLPAAVTSKGEDPVQHELDLLRERCLLYVACTRARDELSLTGSGTPSMLWAE